MKMKLLSLSILAVTLSLGTVVVAAADTASWQPQPQPAGLTVRPGSAPIEQALNIIIPAPYHIGLDSSVPASAVIVWSAGGDWMTVLKAAVAPLDLVVEADWETNTIRIVHQRALSVAPATVPVAARETVERIPEAATPIAAAKPVTFIAAAKPVPLIEEAMPPVPVNPTFSRPTTTNTIATTTTSPLRSVAAPIDPASSSYSIPSGTLLSRGLSDYVQRFGWTLRWNIPDDYLLDAPLPIPAGSVTEGVSYVVHTYQRQGGLHGDIPLFAQPNRVVVIQPTAVREN